MCRKKRKCKAKVHFPAGSGEFIEGEIEAYFHEWSVEAEYEQGFGFSPNAIGIIESQLTGQVYCVTPSAIKFVD